MVDNSDNNFLKIFHNNLVGMILTGEDHFIININDYLLQLTGLKREDVIGKTGTELGILNEDYVKQIWEDLSKNETILNRELSISIKKNKKIDCLFSTEKIEFDEKKCWLTTVFDISQRKKAERELTAMYSRITDGFVALDVNWNYTYVNKSAGVMMDRDPSQMVGKNVWVEFPHLVGSEIEKAYYKSMEKQEVMSVELYFPPLDIWYLHMIYPSPDAVSVFFKDISHRKKDEQKLADSELHFRTLTKTAPVGIFETDGKGLTTYVNETWMKFTSLSFEESMGDKWMSIIHPEDREIQLKNWNKKIRSAEESTSEYRIIDKKGKLRWVNGKAVPIIKNDGEITGYIGTITDVTELKIAMELLQKSEETLNKAQHISKIGNWEFSLLNGELIWSKEQYRIFELEGHPAGMLYEAYRNKYHPEDLIKLDNIIKRSIDKAEGFVYEHRIICNDGSIKYILSIGEVILDTKGRVTGLKGTGQDITDRKKTEEILTQRTEQLRELSSHLQNIREDERMNIAREIHDELGQQLTGLKMDIAWLMKKVNQGDQAIQTKFKDTLALVDSTVKSIRRISTELRPSIIDDLGLNAALEWLLSEFKDRMSVKIKYKNSFDDKQVNPGISIGLFRILQESLTNIAKHANARKININLKQKNKTILLSVADDGIGFDTTTKQTGLTFGLLGIKERTGMMKGDCIISSNPGLGTKIEVKIPLN